MATGLSSDYRTEESRPDVVEAMGERILHLLEQYRYAVLATLTVLYFAGTALRARNSPFWHDEIYSLLLSHLDLGHMWTALKEGLDSSPPMADLLIKAAGALWGEGNIVSRLPAMVGFWVFSLGLFSFVRRRLSIGYAFTALLLPLSTGAFVYAIQARCYGIILGFCGLSLVSWQAAAEGRRRALALPVLAISLAGALVSHFYAVLLLLPYGGAELWRTARRRQIDWPMWGALCIGGGVGLAICYPLIVATRVYRGHPWAVPHFRGLAEFYPTELQPLLTAAIVFLVLGAAWMMFRGRASLNLATMPKLPEHEVVAAVLFILIPAVGLVSALLVTRMFSDRYFISAIAGVVILLLFVAGAMSRGSGMVGLLMLLSCAVPATWLLAHHLPGQAVINYDPLLPAAIQQGPLVFDDGVRFLEQWYYLPPEQKPLVSYISDPGFDAKWIGHDTVDVGMRMLHRWFGVPAFDYASVHQPGKTFRIYHNGSGPSWLVNQLLADGAKVEVLANSGDRSVLRVTVPAL
jgi:hypothetical protein